MTPKCITSLEASDELYCYYLHTRDTIENAIFVHWAKIPSYLKADFVLSSNLILAFERAKRRKHFVVKLIYFNQFQKAT